MAHNHHCKDHPLWRMHIQQIAITDCNQSKCNLRAYSRRATAPCVNGISINQYGPSKHQRRHSRKRSLRRLCFYRCLSVHRAGGVHGRGACVAGWVCMVGGMHGRGHALWGNAWQGACVVGGGACLADTKRYGQWAGGTHPTGMHSCYNIDLIFLIILTSA